MKSWTHPAASVTVMEEYVEGLCPASIYGPGVTRARSNKNLDSKCMEEEGQARI